MQVNVTRIVSKQHLMEESRTSLICEMDKIPRSVLTGLILSSLSRWALSSYKTVIFTRGLFRLNIDFVDQFCASIDTEIINVKLLIYLFEVVGQYR